MPRGLARKAQRLTVVDPQLHTLAMRAALLADDERRADAAYQATLAALSGLDWGRLGPEEHARVRALTARCGRLWDGGWDFSRLRRTEVDELDRLIRRAAGPMDRAVSNLAGRRGGGRHAGKA